MSFLKANWKHALLLAAVAAVKALMHYIPALQPFEGTVDQVLIVTGLAGSAVLPQATSGQQK